MISSSHSVIHRLTPPTCTLEIWGKQSALSKWSKQEIVKDIQFKLSFDDPALTDEQKVTILGDRLKLEAIYEGVIVYVEKFLQQSFPIESFPNKHMEVVDDSGVYLKPQELFFHQLFIPDLDNSPINLSTVQLFDLVTALEEYKTKVASLSGYNHPKSPKIIPLWFKGVAGVVLAVGLATLGTKLVQQNTTESESIASIQESENQNNPSNFDDVVPPEVAGTETPINPEPQETEPLSSAEKLPSPPAVETPKPPPNIPDPAKFPIPEGNLVIPPPIATNSQNQGKSQPNSNGSQVESEINVPQATETEKTNRTASDQVDINLNDSSEELQISNNNSIPLIESESNTDTSLLTRNNLESEITQNSQLKEVKEYFKQSWQPPKELKQAVEYRLIINANGSIKRIIPLGKASEIFIDRTNIPLMGEKFVSPLKNQSQITIRLLLSPDGTVTTFLE